MVQYVGIKTAEEANQINEYFLKRANEHNNKLKRRRNIWAITIFAIVVSAAVASYFFFNEMWKIIALVAGAISFISEFIVFRSWGNNTISTKDWNKPIAYQFFKATDDRKILNVDVMPNDGGDKATLSLTVKCRNGMQSIEKIHNFKLVNHPNAKNVVVDLNGGVIYRPLSN